MSAYRVGVLGLHHDHIWDNLPDLFESAHVELVGVADANLSLLDEAAKYGCPGYLEYAELIEKEEPDAVLVYASNRGGAELAVDALRRGIHVMIEKPMAADVAGADGMLSAAAEGEARLMVNWPFAWWPQMQKAIDLALGGAIGRIWQVKYRAAHQGPAELGCTPYFCEWLFDEHLNGGGALMDYCCYGAVLARVLLGQPEGVTGVQGSFRREVLDVEDNAILVMSYPKAMATSEASWSQIGKLTAYTTVIYGEEGTLLVEPEGGGRLLKATAQDEEGIELTVAEPEPHLASGSAHFIWGIHSGEPFMPLCDPETCRDAQAILAAGQASAGVGATVSL
jgi:predicted dehydrogenase